MKNQVFGAQGNNLLAVAPIDDDENFDAGFNNTFGAQNQRNAVFFSPNTLGYDSKDNLVVGRFNEIAPQGAFGGRFHTLKGSSNYVYGGLEVTCFGRYNDIAGFTALVHGYRNDILSNFSLFACNRAYARHRFGPGDQGGNFCVGYNNSINVANQVLMVGHNCEADGTRALVHGRYGWAPREHQRTFTGGRLELGSAQTSFIPEHVQTTDATPTVLIIFPLQENRAYGITRITLTVRNAAENGENALFTVEDLLAHRDTGGAAVLTGTGAFTKKQESSAVTWTAALAANVNDLELTVTGVAATTLEWMATIWFDEVKG